MPNFSITEDLDRSRGPKTKAHDNIAAIRLLKEVESSQSEITVEQQQKLSRYIGWGGLPQVFNPNPKPEWADIAEEVKELLEPDEYTSALESTLNAHFTSVEVIDEIYQGLEHLGFKGGKVLEPSMGVGNFLGRMPKVMAAQSEVTGIELDSITGRIAQRLYPDYQIHNNGFEEVVLPQDYFDLAVSNVPFGDYKVADSEYNHLGLNVHNYFIARSLDRVRPGGFVCVITSSGTLQSKANEPFRNWVSERANLVGAMRLPGTAFQNNANTEVTTDLIVLQKLGPGVRENLEPWISLSPSAVMDGEGQPLPTNEYYVNNPDHMLGSPSNDKLYPGRLALRGDGRDLGKAMKATFQKFPANCYVEQAFSYDQEKLDKGIRILVPPNISVKNYAYLRHDHGEDSDLLWQRQDNWLVPAQLGNVPTQRVIGMLQIRDLLENVFHVQLQGGSDAEVSQAQSLLNQTYDEFTAKHGLLQSNANVRAFKEDPDAQLLLALETYNPISKQVEKSDVFSNRTIRPRNITTNADTPQEALILSLNEYGHVVPGYMAGLLDTQEAEVLESLQAQNLVFKDPETGGYQTEDEYLSGNVRAKLEIAKQAAETDSSLAKNVDALIEVQPEDLGPGDIEVRLGSPWVPKAVISDFAHDLLELNRRYIRVSHSPKLALWSVDTESSALNTNNRNTTTYGTDDFFALELLELGLNLKDPTVFQQHPTEENRRVVAPQATLAARMKLQQIKDEFKNWVWQDFERSKHLCEIYNRTYNSRVVRDFKNPNLELPGTNPTIELKPHQKDAVWRSLQSDSTLLAHVVGAGKTFSMVASVLEMRRLGIARKPMIVVPNHMLNQFTRELFLLYPNAKVLAPSEKDTQASKRKELMARIATGDWDAVIVTHSAFTRLPISKEYQQQFYDDQLVEIESLLEQEHDGSNAITKHLARERKKLEERIQRLTDSKIKDDGISFEQLGVDCLCVDEAHFWKNLSRQSKMQNVTGLSNTNSLRAMDGYIKCSLIRSQGGRLIFATGTPISNSIAEMFTMQRFLQPGAMSGQGIDNFDAWVGNFAEKVTAPEIAPTGQFKIKTRLTRFTNVPELMSLFRDVADIRTADQLNLPRPEAKRLTIAAGASPMQLRYMEHLITRAERVASKQVEPEKDNLLFVTTDGRRAALDLRLINSEVPDYPESKVNQAIANIHKIWKETQTDKLTQIVFCDIGTPKKVKEGEPKRFSVYEHIRKGLLARGVPEQEIAFIHDAPKAKDKKKLFDAVNTGEVRVLIGSSEKCGVGMNVQAKLIALHHIDPPWRPSDIEQREGRILRQGNQNSKILILTYVTQGRDGQLGFDSYSWQSLARKAQMVGQVMRAETSLRSVDDCSASALSFDEIKAIATGNPLIVEKATVDSRVNELSRYKQAHVSERYTSQREVSHSLPDSIASLKQSIHSYHHHIQRHQDTSSKNFSIKIGDRILTEREAAGNLLHGIANKIVKRGHPFKQQIGEFAGFHLHGSYVGGQDFLFKVICEGSEGVDRIAYSVDLNHTPKGTIQVLGNVLKTLKSSLEECEVQLKSKEQRLKGLLKDLDQPFTYESELEVLLERQQEIDSELGLLKDEMQIAGEEDSPDGIQSKENSDDPDKTIVDPDDAKGTDTSWDWMPDDEELSANTGEIHIALENCSCSPTPELVSVLESFHLAQEQSAMNASVNVTVEHESSVSVGSTSGTSHEPVDDSVQGSQQEPQSSISPETKEQISKLRRWYRAAQLLARPPQHLEKILEIATGIKNGEIDPTLDQPDMQQDLAEYKNHLKAFVENARSIAKQGSVSATGAYVSSGKNYTVSSCPNLLTVQNQHRGEIFKMEGNKIQTMSVHMKDFNIFQTKVQKSQSIAQPIKQR